MNFEATIVGMPRSRTFWFAELLTFGEYHCFHDFHAYKYPIPIRKRLLNSSFTSWLPHTGKIVVIERDRVEAEESFLNFVIEADPRLTASIFDACEESLKGYTDCLRIHYNDVSDSLPEILEYIGVSLPQSRIDEYMNKTLNSPDTSESESRFAYA
jgi:hypothetical protein